MQANEKKLVGIMLILGGIAAVALLGWPAGEEYFNGQATIDGLTAQQTDLQSKQTMLTAEISQLQTASMNVNTDDVVIRTYSGNNMQKVLKEMVDTVIGFATDHDNKLVSLTPWDDAPPFIPPPPAPEDGTQPDPNAPPPPPPVTTIGYEMAVRGSYKSISEFLADMEKNRDLVEISNITLLNEMGADRASAASGGTVQINPAMVDPMKPIRMVAKLRFVLDVAP